MPRGARAASCATSWSATTRRWCAFYERVARAAAKRRLVVNLHGAFKPTGMQRAFPNLLTREGVLGHEWNMWSERVTPDHALTVPFVRMAAGPMDWEGGSMHNGTQKTFRVVFEQPMNQGTRTQQLAQYVLYESPLQYLAGTPSDYRAAPEFTRLLAAIPTTWDETRRDRRRGGRLPRGRPPLRRRTWYLAAMTDWTARTLDVPLAFLGDGRYAATIVSDGMNADRYAADYRIDTLEVGQGSDAQAASGARRRLRRTVQQGELSAPRRYPCVGFVEGRDTPSSRFIMRQRRSITFRSQPSETALASRSC